METTAPPLDLYAASPGILLTELQAAHALQLSAKTLRNRRSSSLGPPWRSVGSSVRYRAGDLVQWIEGTDG